MMYWFLMKLDEIPELCVCIENELNYFPCHSNSTTRGAWSIQFKFKFMNIIGHNYSMNFLLRCWSSRCRHWLGWRQRASYSSCSPCLSRSSPHHERPRSHRGSGSSGDHQSLPKDGKMSMITNIQMRQQISVAEFNKNWIVLTLQLARSPPPPAQIMLLVTRLPHQSDLVQVEWPTTGRKACCRTSAMGPPAIRENKSSETSWSRASQF